LPPVDVIALQGKARGERSVIVRARVEKARSIQRGRMREGETAASANAHLGAGDVERICVLDPVGAKLLADAVTRMGLSARGYGKVLRVARTIADLEGTTAIKPQHVAEAVGARLLDKGDLAPAADAA
jgi:magnesium chelatase family protein